MSDPRVALCMIVRDEEKTLERAINSVLPICDEIIIGIDARSTDKTEWLVKQYMNLDIPVKMFFFAENEDDKNEIHFADERNKGLDLADCDWHIVIDGDEFLAPGHHKLIKRAIKQFDSVSECEVIGCNVWLELDSYSCPVHQGGGARVFRKGVKYTGKQHNKLDAKEGTYVEKIIVIHDRHPDKEKVRKDQRDDQVEKQMLAKITEDPTNKRAIYYMAVQEASRQDFQACLKWCEQYLALTTEILDNSLNEVEMDEEYQMRIQAAQCYAVLEQHQKAVDILWKCIRLNWERNDHYHWLAYCHYKLGEASEDKEYAKKALVYGRIQASFKQPSKLSQFINTAFYSWAPYFNMMHAHAALAEFEQSIKCAMIVKRFRPDNSDVDEFIASVHEHISASKAKKNG